MYLGVSIGPAAAWLRSDARGFSPSSYRELLERVALGPAELLRHHDLDPREQVAAALGVPPIGAPRPLTRSITPSPVPPGTFSFTVSPSGVGTSMVAPTAASTNSTGTSTIRSSPRRVKTGDGRHVGDHVQVAGLAALDAGLALALEPDLGAVLDPGRHLDVVPLGLADAALAVARRARRLDDGAVAAAAVARLLQNENRPWLRLLMPRPRHSGQTSGRSRAGRRCRCRWRR